jgi:hypothetical protein
LALLDV